MNKNNRPEPQLDLNKKQVLKLIETYVSKNDPNELFEFILNTLMQSERSQFLKENPKEGNKANGYRPVTKLGMHKKLKLLIPRDRLNIFKPLIIGILNNQEEQLRELTHALYGKGLTTRQIGSILEIAYGQHYSKSTISRINEEFHERIQQWLNRMLDKTYPMIMIDALYVKVRRDTVATEAFYIVLGLKKDFRREILAVVNNPTESATGWEQVLKTLQKRGVQNVGLFVSDDLPGIDTSISKVFPKSDHQKCIVHLKRNLVSQLRKPYRKHFLSTLSHVFDPSASYTSIPNAVEGFKRILRAQSDLYPSLLYTLERKDLESYFTYLKYDKEIRRMIYTTNWIERFNKSIGRTTKIRDSFPSPHAALMLISYVAMEAEHQTYNYPLTKFAYDTKMNELASD